jgi:hypothetical protein
LFWWGETAEPVQQNFRGKWSQARLPWLGLAWFGLAWLGPARLGLAWPGLVWLGLAWLCSACHGCPRPSGVELALSRLVPGRIFPNRLASRSASELISEFCQANLFNLVRKRACDICTQKLVFLYTALEVARFLREEHRKKVTFYEVKSDLSKQSRRAVFVPGCLSSDLLVAKMSGKENFAFHRRVAQENSGPRKTAPGLM